MVPLILGNPHIELEIGISKRLGAFEPGVGFRNTMLFALKVCSRTCLVLTIHSWDLEGFGLNKMKRSFFGSTHLVEAHSEFMSLLRSNDSTRKLFKCLAPRGNMLL